MRPQLKAGLLPLWRDRDTVQIGVDPRRAAALTGLGMAAAVLSLLDGSRDADELVRTAQAHGISPEMTNRVLGLLASAGVLNDFPASLHAALPKYLRARLAPEMACASLAYSDADGGARTIARRRAAFIRVYGAGRIGACVATFLAASGVGRVSCRDGGLAEPADLMPAGLGAEDIGVPRGAGVARAIARIAPQTATADESRLVPDLAVLTTPVAQAEVEALMRDRVPHLAARADEAIGMVGPLVEPGRSACLRCINLHKAARDAAWPKVLAQTAAGASPAACDTVLAAATAALASAQALAVIDGCGPQPPAAANGTLELFLPEWQWRRRTWLPVANCACGAAAHAMQRAAGHSPGEREINHLARPAQLTGPRPTMERWKMSLVTP
jgi:hypothetical protein